MEGFLFRGAFSRKGSCIYHRFSWEMDDIWCLGVVYVVVHGVETRRMFLMLEKKKENGFWYFGGR